MKAEGETTGGKIKYSVQFKFVALFFLLLAVLLGLLNTYPIVVSRDLVFTSKESTLQNQASVMSSSLAALEALTEDNVEQVMELLDIMSLTRVIITDDAGKILYDTSDVDPSVGSYALFSEISRALSGQVVFYSRFDGSAFMSRASTPVRAKGVTLGAVYLYEYDSEQASLVTSIQVNMRNTSLAVGAVACAVILILTRALTLRITELVGAVRIVSEGDYEHRISLRGNDELTELGEEFNSMTKRLQSTEELRRRFVSDASHELKTPLASIRLLADSIAQSEHMDMETMREFVTDIGNEAERLQRTTDKLLNLTRLDDSERQIVCHDRVDMKKVAENTLRLLSPLAEARDVKLDHNLSEGCYVYGSEDDLYQVIFNLAENGIKYNLPGGEVRLLLYHDSEDVTLIVDDTGIGVPQEDAPHIFSRFYRVDKARSRDAGGSGLGLSIVSDVVRLHGGTVKAEPREDRGMRFTAVFPLYKGEGVVKQ